MKELHNHFINNNRRNFLKKTGLCIGGLALGSMLDPFGNQKSDPFSVISNNLNLPHFAPKAKRIIYLFQKFTMNFCIRIAKNLTLKQKMDQFFKLKLLVFLLMVI